MTSHAFSDVASALGLAALMIPVAVVAVRRTGGWRDPAQAALAIAAVMAVLVPAGLLLSLAGDLGAGGWLVAIVVANAIALVWTRRPAQAAPLLIGAAAVCFAVGALALSRAGAADQDRESHFTQLWLVPRGASGAELGVRNEEQRTTSYRLRVTAPGKPPLERDLRLRQGQSWRGSLTLAPSAQPQLVSAELFRSGAPAVYRNVHIWTVSQR
jgi:hypothetical protein